MLMVLYVYYAYDSCPVYYVQMPCRYIFHTHWPLCMLPQEYESKCNSVNGVYVCEWKWMRSMACLQSCRYRKCCGRCHHVTSWLIPQPSLTHTIVLHPSYHSVAPVVGCLPVRSWNSRWYPWDLSLSVWFTSGPRISLRDSRREFTKFSQSNNWSVFPARTFIIPPVFKALVPMSVLFQASAKDSVCHQFHL